MSYRSLKVGEKVIASSVIKQATTYHQLGTFKEKAVYTLYPSDVAKSAADFIICPNFTVSIPWYSVTLKSQS